ncbi:hypothetical protein [Tenacibaculum jejuense]|uniref:Uncharacterized protein n=1 Tax=Tenacibaculum jejuense TaxID=584609 RepID=A0A238U5W1_9FLAO|nr:hypothetical protein [Tenacibaculum jejuense]SNR14527.1 protein of unknown function [Tenacibaculum jejuense]
MSDFIDETYKRVEEIIVFKNMNISSFEEKIKVSNNSIGTAIRRKASFKSNVLNKILNSFPDINPTWLLTGRDDMLLKNIAVVGVNEPEETYNSKNTSELKKELIHLLTENDEVKSVLIDQVQSLLHQKK